MTILTLTIHFDLIQLDFGLCLTKFKLEIIKHNLGPDLDQLLLCSTIKWNITLSKLNQGTDYVQLMFCLTLLGRFG